MPYCQPSTVLTGISPCKIRYGEIPSSEPAPDLNPMKRFRWRGFDASSCGKAFERGRRASRADEAQGAACSNCASKRAYHNFVLPTARVQRPEMLHFPSFGTLLTRKAEAFKLFSALRGFGALGFRGTWGLGTVQGFRARDLLRQGLGGTA